MGPWIIGAIALLAIVGIYYAMLRKRAIPSENANAGPEAK
jgi:hypothetical protein